MYVYDTRNGIFEYFCFKEKWQFEIIDYIDEYKSIDEIIDYSKKKLSISVETTVCFLNFLKYKNYCYIENDNYISLILPFKSKYQKIYRELEVTNNGVIVL